MYLSLQDLKNQEDRNTKVKCNEIIGQIERTSVIVGLVTLNFIAESINPTVKCLQTKGLHHNKGLQNLQDLSKYFENLTIEDFKPIFEKANALQRVVNNSAITLNRQMILKGYNNSEEGWYYMVFEPALKEFSASIKLR